jgi:hypothetical protein
MVLLDAFSSYISDICSFRAFCKLFLYNMHIRLLKITLISHTCVVDTIHRNQFVACAVDRAHKTREQFDAKESKVRNISVSF